MNAQCHKPKNTIATVVRYVETISDKMWTNALPPVPGRSYAGVVAVEGEVCMFFRAWIFGNFGVARWAVGHHGAFQCDFYEENVCGSVCGDI